MRRIQKFGKKRRILRKNGEIGEILAICNNTWNRGDWRAHSVL